ncbi:hypothetical protein N431DRAFT_560090 [Stipitochalara longipes BDJ]|nr:hypothetical protein N431DRAFT_560090 [Stipitochalara longipes BDJ]
MISYQYAPLRSADHIRLLHIQSGDGDGPIICVLTQAAIGDRPRYNALSYTWELDDPDSCEKVQNRTIFCDGGELSITPNLYAALKSLRRRGGSEDRYAPPFWIDAICINQTDNAERSQQVQIMRLIYCKADRVVAWLGEEQATDYGAKPAFEKLSRYIASRAGDYNANEIMKHYGNPGGTSMPKYDSSDWTAIDSILGKRWFCRVWVIQEIVMAPHLTLRCGDIELDRSVVELILDFFVNSPLNTFDKLQKSKKALRMMGTVRAAITTFDLSKSWTLMEVLWVTRNFGASISRDRLFAFLGIINASNDSFVVPDYDSPDAELYIQWAAHSLIGERPFACLSLACPSRSLIGENLPTWVPDWGAATVYTCLYWNCSFKTLTCSSPHIHLSHCRKYLTLSGVQLDTLQVVGNKQAWKDEWLPKGNALPEPLEVPFLSNEFIQEAKAIAMEAFPLHEFPFEMLWRTLIANTTHGGDSTSSQAPPEYAQSFKAYCELANHLLSGDAVQVTRGLFLKAMDFDRAFSSYAGGRKFGITKGLRMGMFPNTVQQGDIIFAPLGSSVPFVFREAENGLYRLVGECYLHGVMYGEVAEELGWERNVEDITLC